MFERTTIPYAEERRHFVESSTSIRGKRHRSVGTDPAVHNLGALGMVARHDVTGCGDQLVVGVALLGIVTLGAALSLEDLFPALRACIERMRVRRRLECINVAR